MIHKDMTMGEVLRKFPKTKQVFLGLGICDCCGGELTLSRMAKARNLDLEKLVKDLNAAAI